MLQKKFIKCYQPQCNIDEQADTITENINKGLKLGLIDERPFKHTRLFLEQD